MLYALAVSTDTPRAARRPGPAARLPTGSRAGSGVQPGRLPSPRRLRLSGGQSLARDGWGGSSACAALGYLPLPSFLWCTLST